MHILEWSPGFQSFAVTFFFLFSQYNHLSFSLLWILCLIGKPKNLISNFFQFVGTIYYTATWWRHYFLIPTSCCVIAVDIFCLFFPKQGSYGTENPNITEYHGETIFVIRVYCYSAVFFKCHVFTFSETCVPKEALIFSPLSS